MAVYDLEEQEQIEALKAWWKQYGRLVILVVAAAAVTIAGMQAWRNYRYSQSEHAAVVYGGLQQALGAKDLNKIREAAATIMDKYPSTAYASMAALAAARANYAAGDAKSASAQLQWVVDHAGQEEMRDVARLQLAGILLDEKNYTEALKLLDSPHGAAIDGLYLDRKGDVLVAEGKPAEAAGAYKAALAKVDPGGRYGGIIQLKLDALGGAK